MSNFARLLERELPPLRRYARALTRDTAAADDLVQDCLVRALAKQHLWQPGTNLRGWLFTMLHNQRVSELRRAAREKRMLAEVSDTPGGPGTGEPRARAALLDLDRAIGRLNEAHRAALLLVGLEGMAYREAAVVLDVPLGTVRSRVARAREALRGLMDDAECDAVADKLRPVEVCAPARAAELKRKALLRSAELDAAGVSAATEVGHVAGSGKAGTRYQWASADCVA